MKIEVYDTNVTLEKDTKIHFDVMLPIRGNEENISIHSQEFLKRIVESTDSIKLNSCLLCHI